MCLLYRLLLIGFCLLLPLTACAEENAPEIALLSAGGSFAYAVDGDGQIWAWGDNAHAQLGNGTRDGAFSPVPAALGLDGRQIADLQCGNENALFLLKDGTVWTCGNNNFGQQGDGKSSGVQLVPTQVEGLTDIVQVTAGYGHCLALTSEGEVWAWGRNNCGQLGTGSKRGETSPVQIDLHNIAQIACGGKFTLALDTEGNLWGWGDNSFGQLMGVSRAASVAVPTMLAEKPDYHAIVCGGSSAYALDGEGCLWAWGRNDYGQLGIENRKKTVQTPTQVEIPPVARVWAYNSHVIALTGDGEAWGWGSANSGQLGAPKGTRRAPGRIDFMGEQKVTACALGSLVSLLRLENGEVWSVGYNKYGQTGTDSAKITLLDWTQVLIPQLEAADTERRVGHADRHGTVKRL